MIKLTPSVIESRLKELRGQAMAIAKDRANLAAMAQAAKEKLDRGGKLGRAAEEMRLVLSLLQSFAKRKYTSVAWRSVLPLVAAVIYFLNPFDVLPDFLVGGLLDDGLVISWVLFAVRDDIQKYREWEKDQRAKVPAKKKKRRVAG